MELFGKNNSIKNRQSTWKKYKEEKKELVEGAFFAVAGIKKNKIQKSSPNKAKYEIENAVTQVAEFQEREVWYLAADKEHSRQKGYTTHNTKRLLQVL